jgi:hypothetical protein
MILFLFYSLLPVTGQSVFDPEYRQVASEIREHLVVFTDRSLYVAGEDILFRIDYFKEGLPGNEPWSSVVYVELIGPAGRPVTNGKYRLDGGYSSGSLTIPSGTLSGNCILKCYTRWMRNAGPHAFDYHHLKVINPHTPAVLQPDDATGHTQIMNRMSYKEGRVACIPDDTIYQKGEVVTVNLTGPELLPQEGLRCCVTVVPAGSIDTRSGQVEVASDPEIRDRFQISFLPDLGGRLSLSGRALSVDQTPVPDCILYLSEPGRSAGLYTSIADRSGRFSFMVPPGNSDMELFITPVPGQPDPVEIRIDLDFDRSEIPLFPGRFSLTGEEREVATDLAIRHQLAESFAGEVPAPQHVNDPGPEQPIPFYGSIAERINLDEYVNLPTLEEVFINLVPGVSVEQRKEMVRFRIESDNNSIGYSDPLLLVDYIPVFDTEALLRIDPRAFKRIEVIREVYIRGAVAFGGVISFISKNGDMAGIDLPEGAYFFDLRTFYTSGHKGSADTVQQERIPDIRNTVLWTDDVELLPGTDAEISFLAPSHSGTYQLLIRGAANHSTILSGVTSFVVQ